MPDTVTESLHLRSHLTCLSSSASRKKLEFRIKSISFKLDTFSFHFYHLHFFNRWTYWDTSGKLEKLWSYRGTGQHGFLMMGSRKSNQSEPHEWRIDIRKGVWERRSLVGPDQNNLWSGENADWKARLATYGKDFEMSRQGV